MEKDDNWLTVLISISAGAFAYRIYQFYFIDKTRMNTDDDEWSDADDDDADDDADDYDDNKDNRKFTNKSLLIKNNYGMLNAPYKMVFVVNMELGMGKGKIGAQCGHATLGAYKHARKYARTAVKWWETTGQKKICCKGPNLQVLLDVQKKAKNSGLVTYLIADAGHTQIAPGSKTVLAIGPAPEASFVGITDHLKLL